MGTINTLAVSASFEDLTADLTHTLVRCEARPVTAGFAPPLVTLLAEVATTADHERQLVLAVLRAEEMVILTDEDIDGTVDAVVHAVLTIAGGDREHVLYRHFLGNTRPSDLKEPVHGPELEVVRTWVPSLLSSPHASLAALGPVLDPQVKSADQALAQLAAASQALKHFREVGERKALIDKINACRKATHGALGELAHASPQLNLPSDFADRFFRRALRRRRRVTVKELTEKLEAAKASVAEIEVALAKVVAAEKAETDAKSKAKAAEREKKIAEAQQKAAEAAAELAALQSGADE